LNFKTRVPKLQKNENRGIQNAFKSNIKLLPLVLYQLFYLKQIRYYCRAKML